MDLCGCASGRARGCVSAGCLHTPVRRTFGGVLERNELRCDKCHRPDAILLVTVCDYHRQIPSQTRLCRRCTADGMQPDKDLRLWQPQQHYHTVVLTLLAARMLEQIHTLCKAQAMVQNTERASYVWELVFDSDSVHVSVNHVRSGSPFFSASISQQASTAERNDDTVLTAIVTYGDRLMPLHLDPMLMFLCESEHSGVLPVPQMLQAVCKKGPIRYNIEITQDSLVWSSDMKHKHKVQLPQRGAKLARRDRARPAQTVPGQDEWRAQFACCYYCGLFLHPPAGGRVGLVNQCVLSATPFNELADEDGSADIEPLAGLGLLVKDVTGEDKQRLVCCGCASHASVVLGFLANSPPVCQTDSILEILRERVGVLDIVYCQFCEANPTESAAGRSGGRVLIIAHVSTLVESFVCCIPVSCTILDAYAAAHPHPRPRHAAAYCEYDASMPVSAHALVPSVRSSRRSIVGELRHAMSRKKNILHCVAKDLFHCAGMRTHFERIIFADDDPSIKSKDVKDALPRGWYECVSLGTTEVADVKWVVCSGNCSRHGRSSTVCGLQHNVPFFDQLCAIIRKHRGPALLESSHPISNGERSSDSDTGDDVSTSEDSDDEDQVRVQCQVFVPSTYSWALFDSSAPADREWMSLVTSAERTTPKIEAVQNIDSVLDSLHEYPHCVVYRRVPNTLTLPVALPSSAFMSSRANRIAELVPGIVQHASTTKSVHAYALLVNVLGTMAYHEMAQSVDLKLPLETFLYYVWKQYVVSKGSEAPPYAGGGSGIVCNVLLGLPQRSWSSMPAHMKTLLTPPAQDLVHLATTSQPKLVITAALGAEISDLRAMLDHAWAMEQVAARNDARACGYASQRQLMMLHYLLLAFSSRDKHAAETLFNLRMYLAPA